MTIGQESPTYRDHFLGDEGELGVAFGNGGVERGEFAATLSSAHGNQEFVRKICNASTTALGIVV